MSTNHIVYNIIIWRANSVQSRRHDVPSQLLGVWVLDGIKTFKGVGGRSSPGLLLLLLYLNLHLPPLLLSQQVLLQMYILFYCSLWYLFQKIISLPRKPILKSRIEMWHPQRSQKVILTLIIVHCVLFGQFLHTHASMSRQVSFH